MIFKLIKNELIKLMKRPKTWIVFALFAVAVLGGTYLNYIDSKQMSEYHSPQGRLDNINSNINYLNQENEYLKSTNTEEAKMELSRNQESINILEEEKKVQEEALKHSDDPDYWKVTLNKEKETVEQELKNCVYDEEKAHYNKRLKEINNYLDNNIKPIEDWEFDGFNSNNHLMLVFGMAILAAGIAVFMSDIVSGESTPATFKFLLVQPVSRAKIILSKFVAVVVTVVSMIGGLELLVFGAISLFTGLDGAKMPQIIGTRFEWDYSNAIQNGGNPSLKEVVDSGILSTRGTAFVESFLLQLLFIIACCALVFLISSIFKSSMTTMAISVIICVASSIIFMATSLKKVAHLVFLNYGATPSVVGGDIAQLYNNPNFSVGLGISLMCGTIIISYILATLIFNKKDMLI